LARILADANGGALGAVGVGVKLGGSGAAMPVRLHAS